MRVPPDPDQQPTPEERPEIPDWKLWVIVITLGLWLMAGITWAEYALGHDQIGKTTCDMSQRTWQCQHPQETPPHS